MKPILNIVGCGRLGRVLGRLWHRAGILQVQDIVNRSEASACEAAAFIGSGTPRARIEDARPADLWMIATADDVIADTCAALAATGCLQSHSVVFHCSGALASSALQAAADLGCATASVHPIRSFAVSEHAVAEFAGTWCGVEGDPGALEMLTGLFTAIGGRPVAVRADRKTLYHAAAVFASNYLATLLDSALQTYEAAGVPREIALQMIAPLVRGTVENVLQAGPEAALSGPIRRGDMATVERQQRALDAWNASQGRLYETCAELTEALAARAAGRDPTSRPNPQGYDPIAVHSG